MAMIFELYAEAPSPAGRIDLIRHFDGLRMDLLTGRTIAWEAGPVSDTAHAMTVSSRDLSSIGIRTLVDALESTESGLRLYHHLSCAPPFTFARVAWEAELPLSELRDDVQLLPDGRRTLPTHGVLNDQTYRALGSPVGWQTFCPVYWWNGYTGERYLPLVSSDQSQLQALFRRLLPSAT